MMYKQTFFGISMARRRNRRILVITESALAAGAVAFYAFSPKAVAHWVHNCNYWLGLGLLVIVILPRIFAFIRNFGGRESKNPYRPISTLYYRATEDRPEPPLTLDERDIRLRNAAFYEAYGVVQILVVILFFVFMLVYRFPLYEFFPNINIGKILFVTAYLFILFVQVLPRILILWNEPDVEAE